MTVYVLNAHNSALHDEPIIIGIYSSEEKAKEAREELLTIIGVARNSEFSKRKRIIHGGGRRVRYIPKLEDIEYEKWRNKYWRHWIVQDFIITPIELNKTGNLYE